MLLATLATHPPVVSDAIHVVVDQNAPDSAWSMFSALGAAFAGLGTLILASLTWKLAAATNSMSQKTAELADASVSQALQAERHHRQALSPIVVGKVSAIVTRPRGANFTVHLAGNLKNVGPGPAVRVRFVLRVQGTVPVRSEIGAIESGGATTVNNQFGVSEQLSKLGRSPFYLGIAFTDIFGNEGWVLQRSRYGGDLVTIEVQPTLQRSSELQVQERGRKTRRTFNEIESFLWNEDIDWNVP